MTDDDTPARPRFQFGGIDLRLFASLIAGEAPRMFLIGTAPLLLTAFVDDRGFGEGRAAWLSSAELLSSAIVAVAVAGWLTRKSRRATATVGLSFVLVAQLLSIAHFEFIPLLALRVLAGLGAGFAGAAATSAAAGTENPERVFASISFVTALLGVVTVGPIGMAVGTYGAAGVFGFSTLVILVVLPFLVHLPPPKPMPETSVHEKTEMRVGSALAVLAALFVFMLGQNAVWGFTARIGQSKGLSVEQISWILAATALAGLAGAASSAALGIRRGRLTPMLLGIAGTIASIMLLVESENPIAFVVGNAAWTFLFAFSTPYFLGVLAALDREGRWAAMGTGLAGIGAAAGPAAVGASVEANGYGVLVYLMIGTGIATAMALTPVLIRLDREAASGSSGRTHPRARR